VATSRGTITFLDTPDHAAFTAMRARGAQCTDIVILVVAADDGVMPQTVEAIEHAKAASVPIVVAVNKMDKPDANIDNIYTQLSNHHLVPESWGGDAIFIPVSAKTGEGIDTLLESVAIQAEMLELKSVPQGFAKGRIIEARLDKGRGPVATVLVQAGCLKTGDIVLAGSDYGRIRAMYDDQGQVIKEAGPSTPAEILGLSSVPQAGEAFVVVADERKARTVALFRQTKKREIKLAKQGTSGSLEGLFDRIQQGDIKTLNVVLKADVQGSVEALADALEALSTDKIKVKVISRGVGGITESDATLAIASQGILIGFNVRADAVARRLTEKEGIELQYHSIIYDVVDQVKRALNGLMAPVFQEKITGLAQVREVFRSAKLGAVAGCMVLEGAVKRGAKIRVLRDHVVIYQGELESLRRFKEDAHEVRHGMECGIGVKNYNDVKVGDQIETYEIIEVKHDGA
jgi:translation initiation factor IF-2